MAVITVNYICHGRMGSFTGTATVTKGAGLTEHHVLRCLTGVSFISEQRITSQECHSRPTWSYSEPASSRLCCMANCSRSSSSSLMLSLCLPPSMVYPGGASNTHGGISPTRHDTAAHRGKAKGRRWEGVLSNSKGDYTKGEEQERKNRTVISEWKEEKSGLKEVMPGHFPSTLLLPKYFHYSTVCIFIGL